MGSRQKNPRLQSLFSVKIKWVLEVLAAQNIQLWEFKN